MANSSARKNQELKRVILKEVYTSNLEGVGPGLRPSKRDSGLTKQRHAWRTLPYAMILMVLMVLLTGGLYLLYPQALSAIGLGWPERKPPVRSANAFVGYIDRSLPSMPEALLSEEQTNERASYQNSQDIHDPVLLNSPKDYSALVGQTPMPIADLFDLRVKTIAIDPGHGGRDPGAIGPSGLQEKKVTLDIARRLRDQLEKYGSYNIIMTRDDDVNVPLKRRVEFANENHADLFISIHVNYIPVEPVMVVETYFFGAQADEEAMQVAEKENQGSEYVMAEFRDMIEKISDNLKSQESRSLALSIQETLFRSIRHGNGDVANRGIKPAPFVILLGADMPSVLVEVTCLSNKKEEKKLGEPAYREQIAHYLEGGIVQYLEKSNKAPIKGGTEYVEKR